MGRALDMQRVIVRLALVAGLLTLGLWATERLWRPNDLILTIPVAPGREIRVMTWTITRVYIDKEYNHSAFFNLPQRPLMLSLWYYDRRAVTMAELIVLHIPGWPLGVAAAVLLSYAAALWWIPARR